MICNGYVEISDSGSMLGAHGMDGRARLQLSVTRQPE